MESKLELEVTTRSRLDSQIARYSFKHNKDISMFFQAKGDD